MKDFFAKLPPLLATISKAFLNALIEQMREAARIGQTFLRFLGRLFLRSAKWLWAIYYRVETQILGVIVDLGLAVVALRYFFLLLGIGIVLVYFKQWILTFVYVMVLSIAAFRFFRIDSETIAQEDEHHKQAHNKFIRLLRLPFRILASVVLVYASWQFVGWHSLNVPWLHKPAAEGGGKITYDNAPAAIPENIDIKQREQKLAEQAKEAARGRLYNKYKDEGDTLFKRGEYAKAKSTFEEALLHLHQPEDAYIQARINQCEQKLAEQAKEAEWDRLYNQYIGEGDTLFKRGEYAKAKSKFEQVLLRQPQNDYIQARIKQCEQKLDEQKKEVEYTRHKNNGDAYFSRREYDNAKAEYEQALSYKTDDPYISEKILECKRLITAVHPRSRLRSAGVTLSENAVKIMLAKQGFYERKLNVNGEGITHQYELNTDGQVVIDNAMGLMWQRAGSSREMTFAEAENYIRNLSNQHFAGFNDWRLPTLEEAMSLMERGAKNEGLHIDPIFDRTQRWIWTVDKYRTGVVWVANFALGSCYDGRIVNNRFVRVVR